MWSSFRLWFRRWWARHFGRPRLGYAGGIFRVRQHSHDGPTRRSHEIHNRLRSLGRVKRSGRMIPTW